MLKVYVGLKFYRVRSDETYFNDFNITVQRSQVLMKVENNRSANQF